MTVFGWVLVPFTEGVACRPTAPVVKAELPVACVALIGPLFTCDTLAVFPCVAACAEVDTGGLVVDETWGPIAGGAVLCGIVLGRTAALLAYCWLPAGC